MKLFENKNLILKNTKTNLKMCTKVVMNLGRVSTISKRTLSNIVSVKDKIPKGVYTEMFNDLTGSNNIIEDSGKLSQRIEHCQDSILQRNGS